MIKKIAIEGLDGVGKTSVAKIISRKLDLPYVEKPWSLYIDKLGDKTNYLNLINYINNCQDGFFRMCFYSLGTMIAQEKYNASGFVTDRFIISTFIHNRNDFEEEWLDLYFKQIDKPEITVVLYARPEVRLQRMLSRNPLDPDLKAIPLTDNLYSEITDFVNKYKLPFLWIDTSDLSIEEVVTKILKNLDL